jgi:hypothetical protein
VQSLNARRSASARSPNSSPCSQWTEETASRLQANRNVPTLDDERETLRRIYVGKETDDVLV